MGTVILRCTCKSTFQDKKYGRWMRVHNEGTNKNACTVCGERKG